MARPSLRNLMVVSSDLETIKLYCTRIVSSLLDDITHPQEIGDRSIAIALLSERSICFGTRRRRRRRRRCRSLVRPVARIMQPEVSVAVFGVSLPQPSRLECQAGGGGISLTILSRVIRTGAWVFEVAMRKQGWTCIVSATIVTSLHRILSNFGLLKALVTKFTRPSVP